MSTTLVEPTLTDAQRRQRLYAGDVLFYVPRASTQAFCDFAWELIVDAFGSVDPFDAQSVLPVEQFVEILGVLKPRFTHHPRAKELLRDLLEDFGCDVSATYFDVPKLRVAAHSGYLTAGLGYAYKAHRDVWYSCPPCQLNWWMPISEITAESGLAFHRAFFETKVPNNSADFDAYEWNAAGRKDAAKFINDDPRPHPHATSAKDLESEVIVGGPGSTIIFSASNLHATVPNTSGRTRFSVDFRTVHRDDILGHVGAPVVDSESTGTTLRDFMNATTHEKFTEDVVAEYETGPQRDGVLVFEPEHVDR